MANKILSIALAGMLAIPSIAVPAFAAAGDYNYRGYNQDVDCQQSVNNKSLTGGIIGAGVGAIAGSQIAGRGNRTDGSALGAVVGAVIGSQVGKSNAACDDRYQSQKRQYNNGYNNGYYNNNQYGNNNQYDDRYYGNNNYGYNNNSYNNGYYNNGYNDQRGHYGDDYYRSRGANYTPPTRFSNNCGWGTAAYKLPNGRVTHENVYMCKDRGDWVIVNR